MKFHITIKDNDNNEILLDQDTNVIMGVVDAGEVSRGLGYTQTDGKTLLCNFVSLMKCAHNCLTNEKSDDTLWKMAMSAFFNDYTKGNKEILH